jgi:shikimate dehydrogenase
MTLSGKTHVIGIFGHPVSHSASPGMHNAAYEKLGLDYVYVPFDVEPGRVGDAVEALRALSIRGVNVTVPHKEAVIEFLDEIDPLAQKMGAVNTIVNESGKLIGYNTDGPGFVAALRHDFDLDVSGRQVVMLGAGGSCRGIIVSLLNAGAASITILNRTVDKAKQMVASLGSNSVSVCALNDTTANDVLSQADLVVNTTSVGMVPDVQQSPLHDFSWVQDGQCVYDIIYNPIKTRFLSESESAGARVSNGVSMLAGQGVLAFEYFTGHSCEFEFMKRHIEKGLS